MQIGVDWQVPYAAKLTIQHPTSGGDVLLLLAVVAVPLPQPHELAAEKHGASDGLPSSPWRLYREPQPGFPLLRVKPRNVRLVSLPGPSTAYAVRIDSTPFAKQFAAYGGLGAHSLLDIPAFDARQWQVYKIPAYYIIAKQSVSIALQLNYETAYVSDGTASYSSAANTSGGGSMLVTSGTNNGVDSIRPRIESETTLERFLGEWPSLGSTAWTLDTGGSGIRFTSTLMALDLSYDAVRWTPTCGAHDPDLLNEGD